MESGEMLRILITEAEEGFVAQCLEYDICTQGATKEILLDRMEGLIHLELAFAAQTGQDLAAAPDCFHKMWEQVVPIKDGFHQYGVLPVAA